MSFPRYERYKDSGVEWLGEISEHWSVLPGRRLFGQKREPSLPSDAQLSATQKYGVIPQSLFMAREDQKVVLALSGTEAFKHVEQEDFVISLRSFQGGIERSKFSGCVSTAYTVLRATKPIDPDYWAYLLKSDSYISVLSSTTDGIREGKSISYDQFGDLTLPNPPLSDQRDVSTFLDNETAKIDGLIEEQRRLIDLLKEKRQAVISRAVTKGLNPNAPMKDSGVYWIGMIPAHWEVAPIKRWFATVSGGTPNTGKYDEFYTSEGGYPWIRTTDLKNAPLSTFEISISEEGVNKSACTLLPTGSVLIAMYGGSGTIGKNAILQIDATINQALCGLLPLANILA